MTNYKTLLEQIEKSGIAPSDTVMIHSSLHALGEVDGRADGLIAAFREYLSDGLLLIPTHTWANVHKDSPVFDVRTTLPCIGTLPTVAAFHKDAARSLHPTHSLAAFGKRAEEYIANESDSHTPTPPKGCWGRLYDEKAKILLIGVGHNRNTYIHSIDERVDIPNRLTAQEIPFVVVDKNGVSRSHPSRSHYTPGTPDVSANFVKFTELLADAGATHISKIGLADTIVCDAAKLAEVLMPIFEESKRKNIDLCADGRSLSELLG
ncbi:MAG: AAC(3) family N-acetyltransferase [Ruminococcaceae bacterium]|nr:AAC(3) family N-acetyltransferase [Oscillospiraceae bacterium]